jgi:undecaprenyl-diphosphatase
MTPAPSYPPLVRDHAPARGPRIRRPAPGPALAAVALGGLGAALAAGLADPHGLVPDSVDRWAQRRLRGPWWKRTPHTTRLGGRRHERLFAVNQALGGLGGRWPTRLSGVLAAAVVARTYGTRPALPMLLAVPLGDGVHLAIKGLHSRSRPITARLTGKRTPSFPSGHSARAAALTGTVGYAAVRAGLVSPAAAVAAGVAVSMAAGGSRLYIDRHWLTDLVGGWGIGLAVAAGCARWYDTALRDAPARREPRAAGPTWATPERARAPRIRRRGDASRSLPAVRDADVHLVTPEAPAARRGVYPLQDVGTQTGRPSARG